MEVLGSWGLVTLVPATTQASLLLPCTSETGSLVILAGEFFVFMNIPIPKSDEFQRNTPEKA
jgi:hypothetical protein